MADLIISQPMTFTADVKTGLVERPQRESLMRGDKYANRIIVELVDGSQPFDITGVTVKGEFCKPPNGDSINLPGEAKGNVAAVQLTDQCYTAGGHYEARVILVLGEVERTVLFISGDVLKSGSGNVAGDEPGGTGSGLPAGGTAGQVLAKVSSAQGDAIWKTLTASDLGALPSGGTAKNSEKLGGKAPEYYLQPRNLLVNSNFQDPVYTAGLGAVTNGSRYAVDMWKYNREANTLSLNEGQGLSFMANEGVIFQDVTNQIASKANAYTLAIWTPDKKAHFITLSSAYQAVGTSGYRALWDSGNILYINNVNASRPIAFIALYEGAYTVESLPPYVPKGYANELLACEVAEKGSIFAWKLIGKSYGEAVSVPECDEVMLYVTATDNTTYAFNSVILPYSAFEDSYIPMRIFIRGGYATITCSNGKVTLTHVLLDGVDVTQTSMVNVYAR